ncbi:MAG: P-II family nitrogen regulator [Acidobacteria bacterium]|nr:P-II family nitrogen regulator [Acidobacteriota bacterium]
MKEIKAIIRDFALPKVLDALRDHPEFPGLTVSMARGFGKAVRDPDLNDPPMDLMETPPKVKLEIVVPDHLVDAVVDIICSQARTGRTGDGKIFVSSVDGVVKIRTGERNTEAL